MIIERDNEEKAIREVQRCLYLERREEGTGSEMVLKLKGWNTKNGRFSLCFWFETTRSDDAKKSSAMKNSFWTISSLWSLAFCYSDHVSMCFDTLRNYSTIVILLLCHGDKSIQWTRNRFGLQICNAYFRSNPIHDRPISPTIQLKSESWSLDKAAVSHSQTKEPFDEANISTYSLYGRTK